MGAAKGVARTRIGVLVRSSDFVLSCTAQDSAFQALNLRSQLWGGLVHARSLEDVHMLAPQPAHSSAEKLGPQCDLVARSQEL